MRSSGSILFFQARAGSPNHARGAGVQGILGTIKTEDQIMREEKYKQDLKNQIEEKRLQNLRDIARRRAEEEQELAKHAKWQEQMDKQQADESSRKHEKEAQDRHQQQQLEDDLERQRQTEMRMRRRSSSFLFRSIVQSIVFLGPGRLDDPNTSKADDQDDDRENTIDDRPPEPPYRTSSPPVPTLSKRGKKQKPNPSRSKRSSIDDTTQPAPSSPPNNATDSFPPTTDGNEDEREPSAHQPPGLTDYLRKLLVAMSRCLGFARGLASSKETAM